MRQVSWDYPAVQWENGTNLAPSSAGSRCLGKSRSALARQRGADEHPAAPPGAAFEIMCGIAGIIDLAGQRDNEPGI
jgi:hypothetical protein